MRIQRDATWEYVRGALWVLPTLSVVLALGAGSALSLIQIGPDSPLHPMVFQGTADDARSLLSGIAGTMVTVVALVLGLSVVALQLTSTQFSPRLLRNFLRDRPTQVVLSVFVATFAYSTAGLYTVGISAGERTVQFPRLAVTGALLLLFASLVVLVYFAHHLSHSIQIDEIMRVVERGTLAVIRDGLPPGDGAPPPVPDHAVAVLASTSGYVQTIEPASVLPVAISHDVNVFLVPTVGEHVVAGTPLAWAWSRQPDTGRPDSPELHDHIRDAVRIGFERTLEQDAAFGLRQLVDVASKALSPAVNDPYTAVQAVDHLSVLASMLARRPLGTYAVRAAPDGPLIAVPGYEFGYYLELTCAQIRRYGAAEPTIASALLRLLRNVSYALGEYPQRRAAVTDQARLILADVERAVPQPADLAGVRADYRRLEESVLPVHR